MSGPPPKQRRTRAIGPDSIELAKAFTHKTITTTNRSGNVIEKDILVPLVAIKPIPEIPAGSSSTNNEYTDLQHHYDGNMEDSEHVNNPNKSKVCRVLDYFLIKQTLIIP